MRQSGEVVGLVAAQKEFPSHVEVGQLAGGQARQVGEMVNLQYRLGYYRKYLDHLEPALPAPPPDVDRVDQQPLVHRGRREYPGAVQCSPLERSAAHLRGPAPRSQVRRTWPLM